MQVRERHQIAMAGTVDISISATAAGLALIVSLHAAFAQSANLAAAPSRPLNEVSGPTVVSQIHNAPGWEPLHTYHGDAGRRVRVIAGPGWNPIDRSFDPGKPLKAYQLATPGICTSGALGPTAEEANAPDGSCTWKFLSRVDYVSLTGWAFDNQLWRRGTTYRFLDYVTTGAPLRAYALADTRCDSMVAPSGTGGKFKSTGAKQGGNEVTTSDGCHWLYMADVLYSSRLSYIPTQTFPAALHKTMIQMRANHVAELWNDREYVAGRNGEASPIRLQSHNDYRSEGGQIVGCPGRCYHIVVTTAPGESFADSLTPADPLTGYDVARGVAIRNSDRMRWPFEPAGIDVHDNYVDLIGLQVRSIHGAAVNGMSSFGNRMTVQNCILESWSHDRYTANAVLTTDTSSAVVNSLIIAHTKIGVFFKYPGYLLHSTIVNPDRTPGSVGVGTWHDWVFRGQTISNTAIFGFTYPVGTSASLTQTNWKGITWFGGHNVTDASASDRVAVPIKGSPSGWAASERPSPRPLPKFTYGVPMARAFVAPGRDWRPRRGGPLIGHGSAFGSFGLYCRKRNPNCSAGVTYNFDSPDIIRTARPQGDSYDIGAWQSLR